MTKWVMVAGVAAAVLLTILLCLRGSDKAEDNAGTSQPEEHFLMPTEESGNAAQGSIPTASEVAQEGSSYDPRFFEDLLDGESGSSETAGDVPEIQAPLREEETAESSESSQEQGIVLPDDEF